MTNNKEYEKFLGWTNGNRDAAVFLYEIFKISQIIDDVVDQDEPPEMIVPAISKLISLMGFNQFYKQNAIALSGIMISSLTMWAATNTLAKSSRPLTQMYGFVYREVLEQIIPFVAMLCGVDEIRCIEIALEVNKLYHTDDQESFAEWQQEVRHG